MIVSINQPAYLPWLGYLHRIAISDLHIVLDHVQFEKNSFTNRNKVKTTKGFCWLTVPVKTKGRFGDVAIQSLEIDNGTDWRAKHWRTICQNYGKSPYFSEHAIFFEKLYEREWTHLASLCREITSYLLQRFMIATPLRFSSEMNPTQTKGDLVLELCRRIGATTYLSGILGKDYLDEESFTSAGISVAYQDFRHPEYPQSRGQKFESHLAAIDLLFNCGPKSREILLTGQDRV